MEKRTSFLIIGFALAVQACNLFAPVDPLPPTVSETNILQVRQTDIKVSGRIADPDADNSRQEKKSGKIVDFGFVYGTEDNPTLENANTSRAGQDITASPKDFEATLSGLNANTRYFIRVYARNEGGGQNYGPSVSVVTGNYILPTLTTLGVSAITKSSADISFSVSGNSNATIKNYGVCYSTTNSSPTPLDSKVQVEDAISTGTFKISLLRLSEATTYYARPYVSTNASTAYGQVIVFTAGEPAILKDTSFVMNFSNTYDLETGDLQIRNGMEDLYWYPYGQPAGIYPKNGAKFVVMPKGTDFKTLKYSDLLRQNYSADFIDGSYTASSNKLSNGTVLGYVTNVGHYGKMRIDSKGVDRNENSVSGDMQVSIVTYNND